MRIRISKTVRDERQESEHTEPSTETERAAKAAVLAQKALSEQYK